MERWLPRPPTSDVAVKAPASTRPRYRRVDSTGDSELRKETRATDRRVRELARRRQFGNGALGLGPPADVTRRIANSSTSPISSSCSSISPAARR